MLKIFLCVCLLFICLISMSYSVEYNQTACNSTIVSGTHYLIQNITGDFCFSFIENNSILNCQGHSITQFTNQIANYGIEIINKNNIIIKNCVISSYYLGTFGGIGINIDSSSSNISIKNITFIDNSWGIRSTNPFKINNSKFISNRIGIEIYGNEGFVEVKNTLINGSSEIGIKVNSKNNLFYNVSIINNQKGIYFSNYYSDNNSFIESNISENNDYNIEFEILSSYSMIGNKFQDSYLGNWSKIYSNNWSLSPTFFYDNTYLSGTYTGLCFDNPINNTCEGSAPSGGENNPSSTISSIFPAQGSILITLLILLGSFLIK